MGGAGAAAGEEREEDCTTWVVWRGFAGLMLLVAKWGSRQQGVRAVYPESSRGVYGIDIDLSTAGGQAL